LPRSSSACSPYPLIFQKLLQSLSLYHRSVAFIRMAPKPFGLPWSMCVWCAHGLQQETTGIGSNCENKWLDSLQSFQNKHY
jgi:hypothetical protein